MVQDGVYVRVNLQYSTVPNMNVSSGYLNAPRSAIVIRPLATIMTSVILSEAPTMVHGHLMPPANQG